MAKNVLSFSSPKREAKTIEFDLDGDTYHFTAPKNWQLVRDLLFADEDSKTGGLGSLLGWLEQGLPADEYEKILARLDTTEDDLDVDTLGEVVNALIKAVSDRPTS